MDLLPFENQSDYTFPFDNIIDSCDDRHPQHEGDEDGDEDGEDDGGGHDEGSDQSRQHQRAHSQATEDYTIRTSLPLKRPRDAFPLEQLTPDSAVTPSSEQAGQAETTEEGQSVVTTTSIQKQTTMHQSNISMITESPIPIPTLATLTETTLTESLTTILQATCTANDKSLKVGTTATTTGYTSESYPDGSSSLFFSLRRPTIHLRQYTSRLIRYLHVSHAVFITALIYLDRIYQNDAVLALTHLNVHRLLTTAVTIAAKYLEDDCVTNFLVGRVGGVPSLDEMNMLEAQFLRRLQWDCSVPLHVFDIYSQAVLQTRAHHQAVDFDHPM